MVDLVVVGAGITGLAAAWEATRHGADVVVLEAGPEPGGKLRTSTVAGMPVDESADAFLARVPDGIELCTELGIESELISPATGRAYVWVRDQLRPLPEAQLLGVPTDLDAVEASGLLSPGGVARARRDLTAPDDRPAGDEAVGALVRRRLGDEVLDTLVAPLVGGIWAGDCDRLSLETATPTLAEASRQGAGSLIRGALALRAQADAAAASRQSIPPVFLAPQGGMARLVEALVEALGDRIRTNQPVNRLDAPSRNVGRAGRATGRWRLDPAGVEADAVVLATPAFVSAALVGPHCPPAAQALAAIEHASVVLVTLAVPRDGIDQALDGSGYLVPPGAGRLMTACSWTSVKWAQRAGDGSLAVLRVSAGRAGDERALALDDQALVDALWADLRDTMGLRATPTEVRVNRWAQSFPQPRPGHLDRVDQLERDLGREAPGLAVAGAWARGVGIPACVRAGRRAARLVLTARSSRAV